MAVLKETPLIEVHKRYGGKIVDFAGWAMPIQYSSIIEEHMAVRERVGLFDVSHMGEIDVTGRDAAKLVNMLITNDISKMKVKQAKYSPMCYENGGIVDDLLVYKLADDHYLLVVNAGNTDKDYNWILDRAKGMDVTVKNESPNYIQLAIQGPKSEELLSKLMDVDLSAIKYYHFDLGKLSGDGVFAEGIISRTGYTGSDGFEFYTKEVDKAEAVWDLIMSAGKEYGIEPCALGARDTLRLEAGMLLYGHDIDENHTPVQADILWTVKLNKDNFIGKDALKKEVENGPAIKLYGMEMLDKGVPRQHYEIYKDGEKVGDITSGTFAPYLKKYIAMGYIKSGVVDLGDEVQIKIRNKFLKARIVEKPFYKRR
ncbi:MAG: glycine cleavage system aminomethyltransferase GcvT [Synergistetes bacterium]|nr:glycine cleavage system aminomethyltransferase GcvT [Synergistota bacterium]